VSEAGELPFAMLDTGVGHIRADTAATRWEPSLAFAGDTSPAFVPREAVGVGHFSSARMISVRFAPEDRSPEHGRGVGSAAANDPDAVAPVRGTNGTRRNAMPFRVIPDLGQVPENRVQPSTKQRCHILQQGPDGSNHAKGSNHFPPESRTGSGKSGASASERDVLTRESRADEVGMGKLRCGHIPKVRDIGEALGEDARGVGIGFRESDGAESARALQPKVEAAYAGKE
jgi:hypothetical protein